MRILALLTVICAWPCVSQEAFGADLPLPEGTWKFNGDGYVGELVLKVGEGGRVTGSVYGDRIAGWYHVETRRLNFVRMGDAKDPAFQANPTFQTYKGCLFSNSDRDNVRYTLAGTFIPSDPGGSAAGVPEMGWYARLNAAEPAHAGGDPVESGWAPEGTWKFIGDGYDGLLVLKIQDGTVTGTVYDNPIAGSYDAATRRLNFVRLCVPNDPTTIQSHTGYLFANQDGKNTRYTLAGTFLNIGNTAEMGWYAEIVVADPPVRGPSAPGVEALDAVMLRSMKRIGSTVAALTVTRGARTLYSRGYGWSDRERKLPMLPDTPIVIASCDKPLTAAMIRQLAKNGKLDLNGSVFKQLQMKPQGEVVDPRIWDITLNHLLDMSAGWQGEPMLRAWQAHNGGKFPIEPDDFWRHVMVQKLAWTPGEKHEYDERRLQLDEARGRPRVGTQLHRLSPPRTLPALRRPGVEVGSARRKARRGAPAVVERAAHGRPGGISDGGVRAGHVYFHAPLLAGWAAARRARQANVLADDRLRRLVKLDGHPVVSPGCGWRSWTGTFEHQPRLRAQQWGRRCQRPGGTPRGDRNVDQRQAAAEVAEAGGPSDCRKPNGSLATLPMEP